MRGKSKGELEEVGVMSKGEGECEEVSKGECECEEESVSVWGRGSGCVREWGEGECMADQSLGSAGGRGSGAPLPPCATVGISSNTAVGSLPVASTTVLCDSTPHWHRYLYCTIVY